MARHRRCFRTLLTQNRSLHGRQALGRPAHTGDRTCTCGFRATATFYSTPTQNVRVIAKYYTRITLARLTTLLDLTPQQAEDTLCRLVVAGTVWARIDRPAGIVNFRNKRSAEDVMNDWSSDMQKLLGLVEKTWMGVNAAQAAQARTKA
jgi:hypothetical protein